MNINSLLESIKLLEMSEGELKFILRKFGEKTRRFGLKPVASKHFKDDRVIGGDRQDIDPMDLYRTLSAALEHSKLLSYMRDYSHRKDNLIAVITNLNTDLNIVLSFHYERQNPVTHTYDMTLVTAIMDPNFRSDHYPRSKQIHIRT